MLENSKLECATAHVEGLLESLQTNFSIDHERLGEHVVTLKHHTES